MVQGVGMCVCVCRVHGYECLCRFRGMSVCRVQGKGVYRCGGFQGYEYCLGFRV